MLEGVEGCARPGVELLLNTTALEVTQRAQDAIELGVQTPQGKRTLSGSHLLVAVGRTPNSDEFGSGGPAFTHISYDDYRVLRANLLDGAQATTSNRSVPYTLFIDPQLGRVGLSETEARAQGCNVRVAKDAHELRGPTLFAHPTLAESLNNLFSSFDH